jgi:hypothetical protein
MRERVRFRFEREVQMEDVEDSVAVAISAAEGLHGSARVRLDARYEIDPDRRVCVIDVGSPVGESVAQILTGFLIQEFGEDAFRVERVRGGACGAAHPATPAGAGS